MLKLQIKHNQNNTLQECILYKYKNSNNSKKKKKKNHMSESEQIKLDP